MPEQVRFRSHTPPKYGATIDERNAVLALEDRLRHFVGWIATKHNVALCRSEMPVGIREVERLIQEYVET
jgi:hypothetical protein